MKETDLYLGCYYRTGIKLIGSQEARLNFEDSNNTIRLTMGHFKLFANVPEWLFSLKPIPLDEEQLDKLGRTDLGIKVQPTSYPDGDLFIDADDNGVVYLRNCSDGYRFGKELKYVHQAQNTYKALTGKPLTYKNQ